MAKHGPRAILDVIRGDELAAAQQRPGTSAAYQGDRGTGASTQRQAWPAARAAHQAHGIVQHLLIQRQLAGDLLQRLHVACLHQLAQCADVEHVGACRTADLTDQLQLFIRLRVIHAQHEHEAVQFGFWQRVGTFLLDGVLRRHDHERLRHCQCPAFEGHLPLLHHFEQRRLSLGRCAVDLVGQQQIGEYRPLAQLELLALHVVDRMAGDVAGHQVRRELDARELATEAARQGTHQKRLAQSGDTFDQHVATGDQRGQNAVDDLVLADHRLVQFIAQRLGQLGGTCALADGAGGRGGAARIGDMFAHNAFLRLCRSATWRVNSMADRRCAGTGRMACSTRPGGRLVRRASRGSCAPAESCSKPG